MTPTSVTAGLAVAWFALGFFAGLGWHLAGWLVGRLTR